LDTNIRQPFNYVRGYVKGFTSMIVDNIVPVVLGAGAIAAGLVKKSPKALLTGLGIASAAWLGGTVVSGLLGTNQKNSLDYNKYI
jgi:hypothetical protein